MNVLKRFNPFSRINEKLNLILRNQEKTMSAISDYTDRVNAKFDTLATAIDDQSTQLAGIADDVLWLKEKIEELQNNPGPISPADQVLLDALEARVTTTATNAVAVRDAMAALNSQTQRPEQPPIDGSTESPAPA